MILRGHRTQQMATASITRLALMAHEAEETDDDLTSIGLMEELEVRGGDSVEQFRRAYIALWPTRQQFSANTKDGEV